MAQKKKLQVFVSSTYEDLKDARQTAVQAILAAGHIPAGMELFAAGDESQRNVIKRWIDESDVYLLILGGRYGSIEPTSGKSYIHLEFEYAVAQDKALFSLVVDEKSLQERAKELGAEIIEQSAPDQWKDFRDEVTSRTVKFWSDSRDIHLAISQTLKDFEGYENLVGWVRGSNFEDDSFLTQELARQSEEFTNQEKTIALLESQIVVSDSGSHAPRLLSQTERDNLSKQDIIVILKNYISAKGAGRHEGQFILSYSSVASDLQLPLDIVKRYMAEAAKAAEYKVQHQGALLIQLCY